MKKNLFFGLVLLISIITQTTNAQELNEIIKNHITAIGGSDAWSKVNSMTTEMKMSVQGAEINVTMNQLHKKGTRVDISAMGMNGYQIITDKEGWNFMPFQGQTKPEASTPEEVKAAQDDLDIQDDFITYAAYGKTIEYLGKEDIEGTECHKISMTNKDGQMTTYFLDASNYMTVKEVSKKNVNGKEYEMTQTYSNYKKLDQGIVLAMSQSSDMGEMELISVKVNPPIDESLFQPLPLSDIKKK